jgi:hypothetical protein
MTARSVVFGSGMALKGIHVVRLSQQHQAFTFPSDTEPLSVVLDPNAWVMMQATVEKK